MSVISEAQRTGSQWCVPEIICSPCFVKKCSSSRQSARSSENVRSVPISKLPLVVPIEQACTSISHGCATVRGQRGEATEALLRAVRSRPNSWCGNRAVLGQKCRDPQEHGAARSSQNNQRGRQGNTTRSHWHRSGVLDALFFESKQCNSKSAKPLLHQGLCGLGVPRNAVVSW